jgi:gamma-glutamylputrescine oxidase
VVYPPGVTITSRPDLDDNTSVWAATAEAGPPLPPLVGDVVADVVIVGAGFTGLSTAYHLRKAHPDLGIVVLEAKRVGNGASGRNGGMALNWINGVEARDEERCKRIFGVTKHGIDQIERVIAEERLSVRFRRVGCLEVYTESKRADAAQAKTEKLAKWGLPLRWLRGAELTAACDAAGAVGACLDPTTGQLHGLDLCLGLRDVLLRRGVRIHEQSAVTETDVGREHVVRTATGSVRARTLVLATNGYTGRLGFFSDRVFPLQSHVIATEPLPLERWRELGWGATAGFTDDLDRIAYASMTADGRLLFGGGGNGAYDYYFGNRTSLPGDASAQYAFVRSILDRYFPRAKDVRIAHQWTGTLGVTMSRVCAMGVTGEHRNILYAFGYSGHGVVLANLAGEVLCDLYRDHHEPWRDLPFYGRAQGYIPPEPFRWVGYQVFTRLTGRSPRVYETDRAPLGGGT